MNFFTKAREPINSLTHIIGAVLSVIGSILMIIKGLRDGLSSDLMFSCIIFCIALILLYTTSGTYHYVRGSDEKIKFFKRLDHSMIYVLIAGSYTPILYALLPKPTSYYFIITIWGIGIVGAILKILFINMPRWLGTLIYIAMGWFVVLIPSVLSIMPRNAFLLLLAGGISYTVGGLIYWTKKPDFLGKFGFHEVFHIFIMIGSFLHYLMIFLYIA